MARRKPPFRDGLVHVYAKQCATCIYRPGNLMGLRKGRVKDITAAAIKAGSCITCHETYNGEEAVCRGFFDKFPTQPLQVAERLGFVKLVPPPAAVRSTRRGSAPRTSLSAAGTGD